MQTFLPLPSIVESIHCLDNRRLGKQRVEAKQILQRIFDPSVKSYQNHPAVNMWRGYEQFLLAYYRECLLEWERRGYRNKLCTYDLPFMKLGELVIPDWFGNEKFHASHRAALLAKKYDHYSKFGWEELPEINYFWPTKNE